MTTLTLRRIEDHFVVTGPDIEPTRFVQGMILSPPDPLAKGVPKGRPRKAE